MKTFRQELAACTNQQLERIFHLWGMSGPPNYDPSPKEAVTRQNILLQRIKDPIAARFAWEYLAEDERNILYRILGHSARGGVRRDTTLQKSQLTEARFEAAVRKLKQYLLLWEDTEKIRSEQVFSRSKSVTKLEDVTLLHPYVENVDALYTAGKEYYSPKSDRSQMTLDKILTTFYYGDVDVVAQHYGIRQGSYYSQAELRTMIQDELAEPNGVFGVLQRFDPPLRDLCKWLCERGGKVRMQEVRKHTGFDDTKLLTAIHTLEEYALAFDKFSERERVICVPSNIYPSLKKAVTMTAPEEVPTGLFPLSKPPEAIHAAATPIVYDLAVLVGAIYQQNIEPTQAGKVPKRLAAKIQPLMHGQARHRYMDEDDEYMEMVLHIAQELGIMRLAKSSLEGLKPRYEPGRAMVDANFENLGQKKTITFIIVKGPSGWRIRDIVYSEGRTLAGEFKEGR